MSFLEKIKIRPGNKIACAFFAAACIIQSIGWSIFINKATAWFYILAVLSAILAAISYIFTWADINAENHEYTIIQAYIFLFICGFIEMMAAHLIGSAVSFLLSLALMVTFVDLQPLTDKPAGKS